MIANCQSVTNYFGYWPDFADANIARFCLSDAGEIFLDVNYADAETAKAATVVLQFTGVTDVELTDLMAHNVLDKLSVAGPGPFSVDIEACYGLAGSFKCASAQVAELRPNNSFKPNPLR